MYFDVVLPLRCELTVDQIDWIVSVKEARDYIIRDYLPSWVAPNTLYYPVHSANSPVF